MAEEQGQEKTEEPTGRREEEFREEGSVARSPDINALLVIIVGLSTITMITPKVSEIILNSFEGALKNRNDNILALAITWVDHYLYPVMTELLLFMVTISIASVLSSIAQTGFVYSPKAVAPKMDSVNPFKGIQKIFSMRVVFQMFKNVMKVFIISWIVYDLLKDRMNEFVMLGSLDLIAVTKWSSSLIGDIVVRVAILLGTIALLDYIYQWRTLRQKMMMTKQEVKDEMKESELPPHIKSKVKQIANERAKKVIKKEVPTADVIITNPTHYAVAIRYKRFKDKAPKVVAKGQDHLAKIIRDIAKEHNVPFYEYPELARSLYRTVKVGKSVPTELYESLARVLAYIYKLNREKRKVNA